MRETVDSIGNVPAILRKRSRVLILGGTAEAASLARLLVDAGHSVTTSLAGRTRSPEPVPGMVRIGGFGGASGLAEYIVAEAFDVVVDATHPFARMITTNAREAAEAAHCRLITVERPPWPQRAGDRWTTVSNVDEAVRTLPAGATVFLALGHQHIAPFMARTDLRLIIRMVDPPEDPAAFAAARLVIGKPGDVAQEVGLLERYGVTHLVARNSGGASGYAKIEAARQLDLPVIMIAR